MPDNTATITASIGSVWFALVFVNTALAAALGRSRLACFLLSLIAAPIVSLYLAIAGRREP